MGATVDAVHAPPSVPQRPVLVVNRALNDPAVVRAEYATECGLEARRAAYRLSDGPDARAMTFAAVAEVRPQRVLEVGCGPGELSARIAEDLGADVEAVDISPRMVELAQGRGVEARVGDVQALPFHDESFDCAVAAWMLYHVPDVSRGLSELHRVLRPGGRLVAVTNYSDHLKELRELVGAPVRAAQPFRGEIGEQILRGRFAKVEKRDAGGTVRFPDRDAVVAYVKASISLFGTDEVPDFDGPLIVRRRPVIFVAEK
jgi:SAM-dependent methyltransferase